ncbi:MAG: C40 family peptidase, partial [Arachnia propionica]
KSDSPSAGGGSGRASQAVNYALGQVGKGYVMGTAGPSTFDCSGLMYAAYKQVGISLPRTSQAQFSAGTSVSKGDLQPGDLVFYYGGITHVGMYIGNGQIVHAANPRSGVVTASVNSMPYQGARRVS